MPKAMIVGASSGIGRELARVLASHGYALGLAARRLELLEEFKQELSVDVVVQRMDIADPEAAMDAFRRLVNAMGGVDLVVISAATGDSNRDLEWSQEQQIIATNVAGFVAMASTAFRHFAEQGAGHLVGISSIAALRGARHAPAYSASKAFVSIYLQGLRHKAAKAGLPVTITTIMPGFVDTPMAKDGTFWVAPVHKAARQIYNAIRRKKRHAYVTKRWRLIAWLLRLLPDFIYNRL